MSWREALEACDIESGSVRPRYLGAADQPWLRALVDAYQRFEGCPRAELRDWVFDMANDVGPRGRLQVAMGVLDRHWSTRVSAPVAPPSARESVFLAAAATRLPRAEVLAAVAARHGTSAEQLEECLLADLPDRRLLTPPGEPPSLVDLAAQINLSLAAGLLRRARGVSIRVESELRRVVQAAKLRGLLVTRATTGESLPLAAAAGALELTGPLSVLRRTLLYGRALASLLAPLKWCGRFRLSATCDLGTELGERTLELTDDDPIYPASERRRWDSRVEQRFHKDFERVARDWRVLREPEALSTPDGLMFPDFALVPRRDPAQRWLLEVVGFWTEDYLARKRAALGSLPAGVARRFIVCVDEERCAAPIRGALHTRGGLHVLTYRKRIDVGAVLRVVRAPRMASWR